MPSVERRGAAPSSSFSPASTVRTSAAFPRPRPRPISPRSWCRCTSGASAASRRPNGRRGPTSRRPKASRRRCERSDPRSTGSGSHGSKGSATRGISGGGSLPASRSRGETPRRWRSRTFRRSCPHRRDRLLRAGGPDGGPVHALASAPGGSISYRGNARRSLPVARRRRALGVGVRRPVRGPRLVPGREPGSTGRRLCRNERGPLLERGRGREMEPVRRAAFVAAGRVARARSVEPPRPLRGRGGRRRPSQRRRRTDAARLLDDVTATRARSRSSRRGRSLFAATETGVYRSNDRGMTWTRAGKLPARALDARIREGRRRREAPRRHGGSRALRQRGCRRDLVEVEARGRLRHERARRRGARDDPGRLACRGSSRRPDGGVTWTLARVGEVESLAFGGGPAALAGGARGVFLRAAPGAIWRESNAGLSAQVVYVGRGLDGLALRRDIDGPLARVGRAERMEPRRRHSGRRRGVRPGPDRRRGLGGFSSELRATSDAASITAGAGPCLPPTRRSASSSIVPARAVALAATRDGVLKSEDGGLHWESVRLRPREDLRAAARRGSAGSVGRLRGDGGRRRLSKRATARGVGSEAGWSFRA